MFTPTAKEKTILEFLLKNDGAEIPEACLLRQSADAEKAVEGCTAKGFLEKTPDGILRITQAGKDAI